MKKILALLLIFTVALGALSACKQQKNASDTQDVVATVDGEVITADEMNYAIAVVRESMTAGMEGQALEDFWNTLIDGVEPEAYIRQEALDLLIDVTVLAKVAKDKGIEVSDEDINAYFEENQDQIQELTDRFGVTEETLKTIYKKQTLYSKYGETVLAYDPKYNPGEEELKEYFVNNFYKAQHILIMTVDAATGAPLSQEEQDAARAKIDNILLAIKDGADFEDMMLEHSEDTGLEAYPEGYVFTEGEMVTEFYEGTVALSENAVSEVIESTYGYHIIKRLPLDVEADFTANAYKVQSAFIYALEDEMIAELKASMEVSVDDAKLKAIAVK